jgi:hypothetical protein
MDHVKGWSSARPNATFLEITASDQTRRWKFSTVFLKAIFQLLNLRHLRIEIQNKHLIFPINVCQLHLEPKESRLRLNSGLHAIFQKHFGNNDFR